MKTSRSSGKPKTKVTAKIRAEWAKLRKSLSDYDIAQKYGVTEGAVRYHLGNRTPENEPRRASPASAPGFGIEGYGTSAVEIRCYRAPRGSSAAVLDARWHARRNEIVEAWESTDPQTAAGWRAFNFELYLHDHPELASWCAYPGINDDVVEALINMGASDELWLLHTPEAIASLAMCVTDTPYVFDETDGNERTIAKKVKALETRDRAAAIGLLEAALAVVRKAPLPAQVRASESRLGAKAVATHGSNA